MGRDSGFGDGGHGTEGPGLPRESGLTRWPCALGESSDPCPSLASACPAGPLHPQHLAALSPPLLPALSSPAREVLGATRRLPFQRAAWLLVRGQIASGQGTDFTLELAVASPSAAPLHRASGSAAFADGPAPLCPPRCLGRRGHAHLKCGQSTLSAGSAKHTWLSEPPFPARQKME